MSGRVYVVTMDAVAVTAAQTLCQILAGTNNGLEIIKATITQENITTSDQVRGMILRKTGAATVTSFTPVPLNSDDAAASTTNSTSGTGTDASAEGTDGAILVNEGFNLLTGWTWVPGSQEERIVVPGAGIIALKLDVAPAASTTMSAQMLFKEL